MLKHIHSNRLERLFDALLLSLREPLAEPLAPERILVQSQGMARWLAQRMAVQTGVAANLEFPLPASWIWSLFTAWFPDLPAQSDYDREALAWRIFVLLPELQEDDRFAEPRRYLAGEREPELVERKRWQLAGRIADSFDQYLVYRPEMILAWEDGQSDHWQALLWRRLVDGHDHRHRAWLLHAMQHEVGSAPTVALPERVSLFALSALPPAYLGLLGAVSRWTDLRFFFLNPCEGYWADIVDDKGIARRRARALRDEASDMSGLLDLGNPLLASLGHTGQVLLDGLLELDPDPMDLFEPPQGEHLLAQLQRDMLELVERRPAPQERTRLMADDASLQLHVCHSQLREVQVLHDSLLDALERLDGLTPRDLLVMAPSIDVYAPLIEAVFGSAAAHERIPFTIADRRADLEQPLPALLRAFLSLPSARLGADEVLGWLEVPALGRRFGLVGEALERARAWVVETGVRWGLDGDMRGELDLASDDAFSWAFGLKRLFLGLCLPAGTQLAEGIAPYSDIAAGDAEVLGGLQSLIDALAHWRGELARPHRPEDWSRQLKRMLDELLAPDEDDEQHLQSLRDGLARFATLAGEAGQSGPVALALVREQLEELLCAPGGGGRFLSGAVTFCNMVPMRSIPARLICLLGMNAGDFPRTARAPGFDLMAREPRRGDRSRRNDDRYLFLEALLSARDGLWISYVGRDQRDDSPRVPSVVVDELLDSVERGFAAPDGGSAVAHIRREHRLQPFAAAYFDGQDAKLFSYSKDWACAAMAVLDEPPPAFADEPLALSELPREVDLDELGYFLSAPSQWFLSRRLALRLPQEEPPPEGSEPFVLDGLSRWTLRQTLLGREDDTQALELLRARGELPMGAPGELQLARAEAEVDAFRDRLLAAGIDPDAMRDPLELDLDLPSARLTGWLDGLLPSGRAAMRLGHLRGKDRIALWLCHLALNALAPPGIARRSLFIGLGDKDSLELEPSDDALALLDGLVAVYLAAHSQPQALFPETSWCLAAGDDRGAATAWSGGFMGPAGEGADAAVQILFNRLDAPADPGCRATAERVFGPLVAQLQAQDETA